MEISDSELLLKIKENDHEAFSLIFNKFYDLLLNYARHYIKEEAIAEDIIQDAFYYFWEKRKVIEIKISIKSYLFSMVHNSCLDYLKHLKVENEYQQKMLNYKIKEAGLMYPDNVQFLGYLIEKELDAEVKKAIESLPDKCRETFILSRVNELKNREIAEILGVTIKAVEANISRALIQLHKKLSDYLNY